MEPRRVSRYVVQLEVFPDEEAKVAVAVKFARKVLETPHFCAKTNNNHSFIYTLLLCMLGRDLK
jgi:hypothetical protein